MTGLPRGMFDKAVVNGLAKVGFCAERQKSSHLVPRRNDPLAQVLVSDHESPDTGDLSAIVTERVNPWKNLSCLPANYSGCASSGRPQK